MSEQAPNQLPNRNSVMHEFREVAQEAIITDHEGGRGHYGLKPHYTGGVSERVGRLSDKANTYVTNGGERVDSEIYAPDRTVKTVRFQSGEDSLTHSTMTVKRGERQKTLESDNPLVHDMLATIAIREAKKTAEYDRLTEQARRAA